MNAPIISLPNGACDCHLHVIGPKAQYPLGSHSALIPEDAPLDKLLAMHERLGIERLVLIQTSVFGDDNSCMLDALEQIGPRARAVVVVPEDITSETLDKMHRLGVRGVRINTASYGSRSVEAIAEQLLISARMCARHDWHVQIFTRADVIPGLEQVLDTLPVPVVIDHFGMIPSQEETHPTEKVLHRLLEKGNTWVKISGANRLAEDGSNDIFNPKIGELARRFYQTNPSRIVWGTDWPHIQLHVGIVKSEKETPYLDLDAGEILCELDGWFDDPKVLQKILVDNPAELYGF